MRAFFMVILLSVAISTICDTACGTISVVAPQLVNQQDSKTAVDKEGKMRKSTIRHDKWWYGALKRGCTFTSFYGLLFPLQYVLRLLNVIYIIGNEYIKMILKSNAANLRFEEEEVCSSVSIICSGFRSPGTETLAPDCSLLMHI